jgi:hypothetical protein
MPLSGILRDEPQGAPRVQPHVVRQRRHRVADARSGAVADHDEIEPIVAPSAVVHQGHPVALRARLRDGDAAAQAGRARQQRLVQRLEEHAAMQTEAEEPLGQRLVVQIEHRPARGGLTDQARHPRPPRQDVARKPQPLQHEQPRRLHHDPGPDGPRLGHPLEHRHVVPGARQQQRGRRARGPAPDDRHA